MPISNPGGGTAIFRTLAICVNQSGTGTPVGSVLYNDLGTGSIYFGRDDPGSYSMVFDNDCLDVSTNTMIHAYLPNNDGDMSLAVQFVTANTIQIYSYNNNIAVDGVLINAWILVQILA